MKVIKKILMGLGAVFLTIVFLALFVMHSQKEFREKHEEFVKTFLFEYSQSWEIARVSSSLTNEMLSQINTPAGINATNLFRTFGKITDISDFKIAKYGTHTNGTSTGVFTFKAAFENTKGLVTVVVQEESDRVRIQGFKIETIGDVSHPTKVQA